MLFMYVGIVSISVSLLCWFLNKIQSFFMVLEGFSSSSSRCFPEGLRVLVVDNDPETLKNLEKLLKKCKYEVTTRNLMQEALKLLRERKVEFDIVISECNMPDTDGFEFLQHVIVQMDIPVIIMSSDGDTIRVKNVVEWGACDYLVKPIRLKELRNIWQHVLRKRIRRMRDTKHPVEIQTTKTEPDQPDTFLGKKRKEVEDKDHDSECGDRSSAKKPRVIWSADLHLKFVAAVEQLGPAKAGPKKILELMEVPWLKRENVASHLQKYRLNKSREQKEQELKATSDWMKHSDMFSKSSYFQPSTNQNIATAENFVPGGLHIHNAKILTKRTALEANNAVIDTPINTPSGISINQSFGPPDSEANSQQVSRNPFTWRTHVPSVQVQQQQLKPHYGIGQVTDVENTAALFSDQMQSHLAFDTISNSVWTPMNHSLDQNPHYNLPNSDGFSSFGDFYVQNQEPVDYESFDDALEKHLSITVENPVIDPTDPQ